MTPSFDVVIPTLGRESLAETLDALLHSVGPRPAAVIVADDRPHRDAPLPIPQPWPWTAAPLYVTTSDGAGPAAARNAAARLATSEWIACLDDDVVPDPDWLEMLAEDLTDLPPDVAASAGRVRVPVPSDRRPTDAERCVIGLESAPWISADLAIRNDVLASLGGFDTRFRRAYREDTDLFLRVRRAGFRFVRGRRSSTHLLRSGGFFASVRAQAGNADDAMLASIHGLDWRSQAGEPRGALPLHAVTVAAAALAAGAWLGGARRTAASALGAYGIATGAFFARRVAPGPRTPREIASMAVTSALIPPVALAYRAVGHLRGVRSRRRTPEPWVPRQLEEVGAPRAGAERKMHAPSGRATDAPPQRARERAPARTRVRAVLLDRDGTLIQDVPGNGDPARVAPLAGVSLALAKLRAAGLRTAIVTNQGAQPDGKPTAVDVERIHARVSELLGPFDGVYVCLHTPDAGCACRKPAPGLIDRALRELGVEPEECVLVGDTAADVAAARAAGVRPILVPNAVTRRGEIADAPEVARDLGAVARRLLDAVS